MYSSVSRKVFSRYRFLKFAIIMHNVYDAPPPSLGTRQNIIIRPIDFLTITRIRLLCNNIIITAKQLLLLPHYTFIYIYINTYIMYMIFYIHNFLLYSHSQQNGRAQSYNDRYYVYLLYGVYYYYIMRISTVVRYMILYFFYSFRVISRDTDRVSVIWIGKILFDYKITVISGRII